MRGWVGIGGEGNFVGIGGGNAAVNVNAGRSGAVSREQCVRVYGCRCAEKVARGEEPFTFSGEGGKCRKCRKVRWGAGFGCIGKRRKV